VEQSILRIDPAVDVVSTSDGTITFRTPQGDFSVTDPFGMVRRVTDQCRSGATSQGLECDCGGPEEADQMRKLVRVLRLRRVLTDVALPHARDPLTEWVRYNAGHAPAPLKRVALEGDGRLVEALAGKLMHAGLVFGNSDDIDACLIAVTDHADIDWLLLQNQDAVTARRPFLPVWVDRSTIHWGPMVLPGATGCLECWWHRRNATARKQTLICELSHSTSPIVVEMAAGFAAAEILRWASDAHVSTELGMAWRFDVMTNEMNGGLVMCLPRCPSCGT